MPSSNLSPLDLAIVAIYIIGTTLLGAWFTRRQTSVRTYFVGDRNVSWWLVLVSIVATETSTVTFLSIPGKGFDSGDPVKGTPPGDLTFLQLAFGYIIGRIVVAWILLPQYLRGEMFSAYQLLRERFDVRVQRTASALFLVTRTVADGLRLWLTGLLLQQFTGWDISTAILVLGGVTIVYTYLGGMEAVIWTDLVQFIIYVSGALLAGWFILRLMPGGWDQFFSLTSDAGRFRVFDFDTSILKSQTIWAGLIGGAFVTMASHGADQNMVQRYLCARSLSQARAALILSGVLVTVQFALFLCIGLGLWALKTSGGFAPPPGTHNDAVFGMFIVNYLPTGLVGLVVAAVLASAMASFSSSLNSAANAVVADFYRPLRPHHAESTYLRIAKAMTSVVGVAKVGVALACVPLMMGPAGAANYAGYRSVVDQVLAVASVTLGLILGLFALGTLPRPVGSAAALVGLVAGFVVAGGLWLSSLLGRPLVAWPWLAPAGTLTTVFVALIANAIGPAHVARPSADRSA